MSKPVTLEAYHRRLSLNNAHELPLVKQSNEIWGKEAVVLAHGVCVQAYPYHHGDTNSAYSFGTEVVALAQFGFFDRQTVIREVRWNLGMDGVQERENGKFACISVDWIDD